MSAETNGSVVQGDMMFPVWRQSGWPHEIGAPRHGLKAADSGPARRGVDGREISRLTGLDRASKAHESCLNPYAPARCERRRSAIYLQQAGATLITPDFSVTAPHAECGRLDGY